MSSKIWNPRRIVITLINHAIFVLVIVTNGMQTAKADAFLFATPPAPITDTAFVHEGTAVAHDRSNRSHSVKKSQL